jgi:glycosyltransferase involved in cell wall biosynthesis
MTVLILETGGWGGIAHYTYNLSEALSKFKDFEIILLTGREYELDSFPKNFRIIKKPLQNQAYFKVVFTILVSIFRIKPSIIHIQSLFSPRKDWIFFLLAKLLGIPIVYTVHNILPHEEKESSAFGLRQSLQIVYKTSRRLIVHSQSNMQELANLFKIKPQEMSVIPHGNYFFVVPHNMISKGNARKQLGFTISDKLILIFGAIRKYKGIDYLIKAFKRVIDKVPDAKLLIVGRPMGIGETSPMNYYYNLVEELQLKERIIFNTNYIPLRDIHIYFTASDAVAFPYLDTTESGSLQLAFAFSKPVIATRVGSFSEAIEQNKNGLLVPPRNDEALAKAIINILSIDEKILSEMGKYSRYIAEKKYNWKDIGRDTLRLYKEVLHEGP